MALYELVFIVRQEVSPVRAKELAKKINDFVKSKGGDVKKEEYWGFRNLAYKIKKNKKGHYLFFVIKLTEEIIRHVIMRIKEKQYFKEPTEMITDENND